MANFLDKVKVKTATNRTNKFNLSCSHVTTQDMFVQRVCYVRELMPRQTIEVDQSSFIRLAPLDKPFYGSLRMVNRAFFVPFRTIFKSFTEFYTDTPYIDSSGQVARVSTAPYIGTKELEMQLFGTAGGANGLWTNVTGSADVVPDMVVHDNSSDKSIKLTPYGRRIVSLLNSLGYTLTGNLADDTNDVKTSVNVSVLPIFAFAKVYADWYTDSQYEFVRNQILSILEKYSKGGLVSATDLWILLSYTYNSLYDKDYFTAAYDNPLVPNDGTMSSVTIPEIKDYSKTTSSSASSVVVGDSHVVFDSSDNQTPPPYIEGKSSYFGNNPLASFSYRGFVTMLNQFMLDSLKALTDYVRRYQLVGSRTLDRYLSLFGIKLESAKLNRSIYVGKNEFGIDIADVMSTAQTEGALLGDYAAKGVGYQPNQKYSYTADEFGLFMILSTLIPRVGYVQGINRMNLHIDRLDFFQGDFDALGTQAIARCELFNDISTQENFSGMVSWNANGVYGYTPRFSEYAVPNDFCSGDFRFNSLNTQLKPWHLFRLFNPETESEYDLIEHHDENFDIAQPDQYNRIFNYKENGADHFYCVHNFNVVSYMPKKPLFEQYDFEDGATQIMQIGGTNLN